MKKLSVLLFCVILILGVSACSFKNVKVIEISFYDDVTLIETMSLTKYNNSGIESPTKKGYTFTGWYLDRDCTKQADFSKIEDNCNVYAGWSKDADTVFYTVTFMNDNTVIKTVRASTVSTIAYPEDPQKSGYVFNGWKGIPEVLTGDVTAVADYLRICKVDFYINESDREPYATKSVIEGQKVDLPNNPSKADTKEAYYTFKGWQGDLENVKTDVKAYAIFDEHKITYNYTFLNYDGKVLSKGNGYYKSEFKVPTAEKSADESFIYVLDGFDLDEDGQVDDLPTLLEYSFTAKAVYTAKPRAYTVNFYNGDVLVDSKNVDYGNSVESDVIPQKESDAEFDYVFSGWDKDLSVILSDTDVYALYSSLIRSYTYKFINYAGATVKEVTAEYGTVIIAPEDDFKPSTNQNDYIFEGWDGFEEGMILIADIEFESEFTEKLRTYVYEFIFNNQVYATGTLEYGEEIPCPPDPTVPDGYKFNGWSGYTVGAKITGKCQFTARIAKQ